VLPPSQTGHTARGLLKIRTTETKLHPNPNTNPNPTKGKKVGFLYSATYMANQNSTLHNLGSGS